MAPLMEKPDEAGRNADSSNEGRDNAYMDIDRMVNEGLGGGNVTADNGFIGETTTDTMDGSQEQE